MFQIKLKENDIKEKQIKRYTKMRTPEGERWGRGKEIETDAHREKER